MPGSVHSTSARRGAGRVRLGASLVALGLIVSAFAPTAHAGQLPLRVVVDADRQPLADRVVREVRALLGDGTAVAADVVAWPGERASTPPTSGVLLALGPNACAWADALPPGGPPTVLAGLVVADTPPKPRPGRAVGVGWSLADARAALVSVGAAPVVVFGPGAPAASAPVAWLPLADHGSARWDDPIDAKPAARGAVVWPMPPALLDPHVAALRDAGVVVFSMAGGAALHPAAAMGPGRRLDAERVARWVALQIQSHVRGERLRDVADLRPTGDSLALRFDVFEALQVPMPWQLASRSRLLVPKGGETLSLTGAISEALSNSPAVAASRAGIDGAEADVASARAALLPQLDLGLSGRWIDQDSARASNGGNPELSLDLSASVTATLYSHDAWAQFGASRHSEQAERLRHRGTVLDLALNAALSWVGVQRARATLEVRARNLDDTRLHQGLAEARRRAGRSGDADVLRWESQVATDTAGFLSSALDVASASLRLDQALGRSPGKRRAPLQETAPTAALAELGAAGLPELLDGPSGDALEGLMIRTARELDPDLRRFEALIAAQDTLLEGTREGLFIPTFRVQAQLGQQLAQGGEGDRDSAPPAPFPALPDQTTGQVLLSASWPVFDGGTRYARIDRAAADLTALQRQRDDRLLTIDQDVRVAFRTLGTALATARLQRAAADTATRNLALVTASYQRGGSAVVALLDAQTQQRQSLLAAVNAEFAVVEAVLRAYRAVGAFYPLLTDEEKERWNQALQTLSP